jgi:hypothetical protein
MYQTTKRGLQVLVWTDMLKGLLINNPIFCYYLFAIGFMIALGWTLREPTTINYPFEKGPLSPVRIFLVFLIN